jgi:hypothetical protein
VEGKRVKEFKAYCVFDIFGGPEQSTVRPTEIDSMLALLQLYRLGKGTQRSTDVRRLFEKFGRYSVRQVTVTVPE